MVKRFFRALFCAIFACGSLAYAAPQKEPQKEIVREETVEPVVILGGGMGALTSALYLGRAGLEPLVIEGATPGGLLTQSHTVQNWPGEMEIDGTALTAKVRAQAEANGARIFKEEVVSIDFSKRPFSVTTRVIGKSETRKIVAESVIIAMGTKPNFLNIPGESGPDGYFGRGVTNCAICDGNLYRGKKVAVVGGGDAAVLEALYLSNIAKEVSVFVRKGSFKAVEAKRLEALLQKTNVKIVYNTTVQEVKGDGTQLTSIVVQTEGEKPLSMPLDGLFLAIGSKPNTALFKDVLTLDPAGYIALTKDQQTSIPGIYAIGDIVDPVYKQAISAAGDGAKAALAAQQYISDRTNHLVHKPKTPLINPVSHPKVEVIEIATIEQFNSELQSDVPIVIDFYATWCPPCKLISPVIDSFATQLSGKVKFLKVNVDTFLDLSDSFQIRSMPTVLLLDSSGTELERQVGQDQITDLLQRLSVGH